MDKVYRADGIKWLFSDSEWGGQNIDPLCPIHHTDLKYDEHFPKKLFCVSCNKKYPIPRILFQEKLHVLNQIEATRIKKLETINLDDEAVPLAKEKLKNNEYFVTGQIMKSKSGTRLVIYAGRKGSKEKTQIFVETDIKRLSFDQKDLNPSDVFTKFEAIFLDGTKTVTSRKK